MEKQSLAKSASVLSFSKVITIVISTVTSMLLSRYSTLEEYGTYSQLLMVITLATALLMLGLPNSVNYYLPLSKSDDEKNEFLSVYYSLTTIICVILGAVLVAIIPWIELYFNNNSIRNFAYFLAIYPWANVTISGISNVLVVYGKTLKIMAINIVTAIVSFLSVAIIQLFKLPFNVYILVFLVGNCIISIWLYIIVNKLSGKLKIRFNRVIIKDVFSYSIPIGLATLVGTISIEIDKLMIGRFLDTESLAYYTNAGKELPLTFVATALISVLMPHLVVLIKQKKYTEAVKLWSDTVELSYWIIAFFVATFVAFSPQVLTFLYSEKYLPGLNVFVVYTLVLLLRCTYFGILLNASGNTKSIFKASIFSLTLNTILNYIMFKLLGFIGPAIATFISILVVNLIQLKITSKIFGISFKTIFPWGKLLNITLINFVVGIISFSVVKLLGLGTSTKDIIICIILGIIFMVIYFICFKSRFIKLWDILNSKSLIEEE